MTFATPRLAIAAADRLGRLGRGVGRQLGVGVVHPHRHRVDGERLPHRYANCGSQRFVATSISSVMSRNES